MKIRLFVLVLLLTTWASAGITLGTANSGNCIPWSCSSLSSGTYEQIYNSTAFPGTITISDIEFFNTFTNNGPLQGVSQIQGSIYFYVTNETVPDGSIPGGAVLFATGGLSGQNWPFGKSLIIDGTPFFYDPANGNLEMIVVPTSNGDPLSGVVTFFDAEFGGPFSRWCGTCGGNQGYGLVTGFNSAIPEPSSLVLLGSGVLGLAGTLRRKFLR